MKPMCKNSGPVDPFSGLLLVDTEKKGVKKGMKK